MLRKTLLLTVISMLLVLVPNTIPGQDIKPASENEQSLLRKSEIIELIHKAQKMSTPQQKRKIEELWTSDADSKTPRSDFLYCTAFAYMNDPKAQACLGRAFEKGHGIVSDLTDAYVWYTISLENDINDTELKESIQAGQARVNMMLLSVYPAPSEFELEEAVQKQKDKIKEYTSEAGSIGH